MTALSRAVALVSGAILGGVAAFSQIGPATASVSDPQAVTATQSAPAGHALTREDVEAWFDGFFPAAMSHADIAGAVVVVVKDGHVLLEKGYGFSDVDSRKPVDPARTLFRPGSISKLFTWTSVMQLVEAGKLDLDRDINDYLDFRIPPAFGKPITLRNLMTHTPGFEEHLKGLFANRPRTLRQALVGATPVRIYPPGEVSAYSNYGAALAGYIVQRISGEPFDAYVARHIFAPLKMAHSSFAEPLPPALARDMSKGYVLPERPPQPFEYVALSPAGALSASGDDIAHFMIAHLGDGAYDGAAILKPGTVALMHRPAFSPVPLLPAMALGFYHEDRNGRTIIGHGGDLIAFHSDLHLILDEKVGLFVSVNSAGHETNPLHGLRTMLMDGFMDRYFPIAPPAAAKPISSARDDARKVAGYYRFSRRSETNFLSVAALLQPLSVVANSDGSLSAPLLALEGGPKKWIEVAPTVWREEHGAHRIVGKVENGRLKWASTDLMPPIMVLQPISFWQSGAFNLPLMAATLLTLLLVALFWPIKAILRWRYDRPFELKGGDATLYRWTRVAVLVDLAAMAGWGIFLLIGQSNLSVFDSQNDGVIRLLQLLSAAAVGATIVPIVEIVTALRDPNRFWWTKASDGLIVLASLAVVWFVFTLHLVTVSLNY